MKLTSALLVDDSPSFLESAVRYLTGDGRVDVVGLALSGREALEQVEQLRPDLVLMDLAMPEMNGLEATRRLKAHADSPRIIILTLHDTAEYRAAARDANADGFIAKSDFGAHLLPLIEQLCGSPAPDGKSVTDGKFVTDENSVTPLGAQPENAPQEDVKKCGRLAASSTGGEAGATPARWREAEAQLNEEHLAVRWRQALLRLSECLAAASDNPANTLHAHTLHVDAIVGSGNVARILQGALHAALEQLLMHGEQADLIRLEEWLSEVHPSSADATVQTPFRAGSNEPARSADDAARRPNWDGVERRGRLERRRESATSSGA